MSKSDDKISFSQEMQLSVLKKRTAFPVDMVDWDRLKRMISNSTSKFSIWANISSAGFSASLAIFLTWLTVLGEKTYLYKNHLLTATFVTATIGIMAGIFAWSKKKDEEYSQNQILREMETMQVSSAENPEEVQIPNKFKIIKATYGVPGKDTDVTQKLNDLIIDDKLTTQATNALAGDPAPGTPKFLEIEYENEEGKLSKKYAENEQVNLP
ncbi:MAG: hypothetical protein UV55_C0054G0005 [Candidatus Gottesmanbacteria bacterium GW2011_GWC1_43_10]|nr:MAG: hypothetical protein UV04_C0042G0006 [Candidatus Gottesmanbacteria bacterium GW2011_GWA2_42_16]KKS51573.1 MAG: hypothetical protein UV17_C0060G0015 [Candidatus Gottesmanbacteria bacterium GW2011_GWA1_42_26]KKS79968.1 MAG: hypothetical protein UV55_C0054G0005 [Candidatus Gottesmanbacteria bacterium GW2011_GWC1_43_10]OGG27180.1 MAG: hypothetical protein A3A59_01315 [Candidatus Gottesmanbacteria bacterium RIFCSPLOWO2_01_FULL_42_10]